MLGSNADGTNKLNPLVIGSAKSRIVSMIFIIFHYDSSKNAWMTSRISHDWFHKIFVKEVSSSFLFSSIFHIFNNDCCTLHKFVVILRKTICHRRLFCCLITAVHTGKLETLQSKDGNYCLLGKILASTKCDCRYTTYIWIKIQFD